MGTNEQEEAIAQLRRDIDRAIVIAKKIAGNPPGGNLHESALIVVKLEEAELWATKLG